MDKLLNLYYYFKDFEEKVNKDEDLKRIYEDLTKNINDSLIVKKSHVEINSDWINYLSANIHWIDDAIDENRQFIREDGEVLPVERVKKINKNTIADLSKHSDYIEKLDKDGNVIPSKLYTVNKDTDFGIYENRFLFLLLKSLREFIVDQIQSINDSLLSGTTVLNVKRYDGFLDSDNELELIYRSKRHNQSAVLSKGSTELMDKANMLLSKVDSILTTPLMKLMARESIISGEITKTNVLRMDEAFKHCLEMYEYITGYTRQGYIVNEENIEKVAPDLRAAVIVTELLTFISEFDLSNEYGKKYLSYSDDLREERIKLLEESLKDKSRKDYIIDLEALVEALKEKTIRFEDIKALYEALEAKNETVYKSNEELSLNLKDVKAELDKANSEYLAKLNSYIENARNLNEEGIKLKAEIAQKDLMLNRSALSNAELKESNEKLVLENSNLNSKLESLNEEMKQKSLEAENKINELNDKISLLSSVISANEIMNKTLNGSYTSKEEFDELERQYEAFKKFFDSKWKETKKKIKKEMKGE